MIVDRALIPDSMVIQGSSGSLQMVDHTLIDVPLVNVYLDSPFYKGHCKVMCVSSHVYPVIIGNVRCTRCCQTQTGRLRTREKPELGPMEATTMSMTTKVVICLVGCSKRSPTEKKLRIETQRRSQPRSRRMITMLLKILSPRGYHRRKVCCLTSVDKGSGEEE